MFHLEVVVFLVVPSAGRRWGTCSLILDAATEKQILSSGASTALGGRFFFFFLFSPQSRSPCPPTPTPHPNFYLQPPWPHLREVGAALPVSPVLLCLLLDGGRAVAGWQLAPPLSPVISCVSLLPLWRASVHSDRLFWTEIPASLRQSKQALPQRSTETWTETQITAEAAGPLFVCQPAGAAAAFAAHGFVVHKMSIRFDVFGSCDFILFSSRWGLTSAPKKKKKKSFWSDLFGSTKQVTALLNHPQRMIRLAIENQHSAPAANKQHATFSNEAFAKLQQTQMQMLLPSINCAALIEIKCADLFLICTSDKWQNVIVSGTADLQY